MIEKLLKIQQELKVPKNKPNTFGNYNYRSCEDIVEAAKPLCHREGLVLTLSDEVVGVGDRVYVKATATLAFQPEAIFTDTEGELRIDGPIRLNQNSEQTYISCFGWAREAETKKGMDEAQITGSASSYARKYALNGLFAIDDTKDADATNDHGKTGMSTEEACAKLAQAGTLEELKKAFTALPKTLQSDVEVIAMKDELKNKLS